MDSHSSQHVQHLLSTLNNLQPSVPPVPSNTLQTPANEPRITPSYLCRLGNALQISPDLFHLLRRLQQQQIQLEAQWRKTRQQLIDTSKQRLEQAVQAELPALAIQGILKRAEAQVEDLDKQLARDFEGLALSQQRELSEAKMPGFEKVSRDARWIKFHKRVLQLLSMVETSSGV